MSKPANEVEFTYTGYPCYVDEKGWLQIVQDPNSKEVHPTQILGLVSGKIFPPYGMAGLSDLFNLLCTNRRRTRMGPDKQIRGFSSTTSLFIETHKEALRTLWPEFYEYSLNLPILSVAEVDDEAFVLQWVSKIEERFGRAVPVTAKMEFNQAESLKQ